MSGAGRNRPRDVKVVRADEIKDAKIQPIAGWLLVLTGKHKGEDFRLREGKNSVGSAPDGEVVLTDDHMSLKHANINVKRASETTGSYSVIDLDSTNGTFLNDGKEKITKEELVDNDTIVFGTTRCKFKCV